VDAVVDLLAFMLPASPPMSPPPWKLSPPKYPRRAVTRTVGGAREQAHVVRVYPGLSMHDPRLEALEVLTTVLGGQVGRLFQSLREDKGLVYHVSAGASEGLDAGHVSFYAATSHRGRPRALAALDAELQRVVAEPISAEELARAKAWLCGQFEVETQRRSRIASAMAFDEAYGMGASLFTTFPRRIRAVTIADVHAVAQELLQHSRSVTVQTRDPASRASLPG
jgi:zinc protease